MNVQDQRGRLEVIPACLQEHSGPLLSVYKVRNIMYREQSIFCTDLEIHVMFGFLRIDFTVVVVDKHDCFVDSVHNYFEADALVRHLSLVSGILVFRYRSMHFCMLFPIYLSVCPRFVLYLLSKILLKLLLKLLSQHNLFYHKFPIRQTDKKMEN